MSVQCACFTPYRAGSIREIRRESVPSAGRLILATLTRGADDAMELEIRSGLADDSLSNLPSVTNRRLQTLVARLDGKWGRTADELAIHVTRTRALWRTAQPRARENLRDSIKTRRV